MPLTPPVAPCHGDRCFYAATITAAATTLFLLGVIAAAAASVPTYWSAREANTAFLRTAWASTHHASAAACVGRGGHIHSATGTPLYRYFICLVTVPGKLPDALKWVWLRAANPAATSAGRPDDLADNPLAPTPPSRFRRQYWNAEQALTALARTSFARTRNCPCYSLCRNRHIVNQPQVL